ncbi:hypothetical protein L218DRAFT_696497 [Marasmius fiardii PR-910]|nr:hypothetical protein L218DRAFT_696497 [Marasmius fiardii PR-910]
MPAAVAKFFAQTLVLFRAPIFLSTPAMVLSSLLLAGNKSSIDKELDSLFKTNVPIPRPEPTPPNNSLNLKRKNEFDGTQNAESSKRVKGRLSKQEKEVRTTESQKSKKQKAKRNAAGKQEQEVKDSKGHNSESDEIQDVGSDDEDNSDLENAYLAGSSKQKAQAQEEEESEEERELVEEADTEVESDSDAPPPQHESLSKSSKRTKPKSAKLVPADETPEQRDARTIFVGNLALEVAQKKPLRKQLQRHILSLIPTTGPKPKVESIRFRSVPFAFPTSALPEDEDDPKAKGKGKKSKLSSRHHDLERTSHWRDKNGEGETEKKFLTPAQKKKVAFITQDFHSSADNMHAYIVFAHSRSPNADGIVKRTPNLPPPEVMDPYEAARLAKEACDGTLFMDRVIRVDVAAKSPLAAAVNVEGRIVKTDVDPKKCVFVGNLDFEGKEEDVRAFFEGVISAEKGPRIVESAKEDDIEDEGQATTKPNAWVKGVRIIRDKDTQLGKGFAYVQFVNHECVDEILALEPSKLKFAKRKLRVERCKTLPGVSTKLTSKPKPKLSDKSDKKKAGVPSRPTPVPKGDPGLGEKLVHLSKEDRKKAKAADPERLARRLAKKKARIALATEGGVKVVGKDRDRERITGLIKKGSNGKHGVGSATKGRVRSEKSAARRNMKK